MKRRRVVAAFLGFVAVAGWAGCQPLTTEEVRDLHFKEVLVKCYSCFGVHDIRCADPFIHTYSPAQMDAMCDGTPR
jgi:hypothetical protein